VFLGLAFYSLYAVLHLPWICALGRLLGFLGYESVLFSPLCACVGKLQAENVLGQFAASAIIIFSASLGVYDLIIHPATRPSGGTNLRRS
jgi:hypothetical protein